jgi:hypothetical protein
MSGVNHHQESAVGHPRARGDAGLPPDDPTSDCMSVIRWFRRCRSGAASAVAAGLPSEAAIAMPCSQLPPPTSIDLTGRRGLKAANPHRSNS